MAKKDTTAENAASQTDVTEEVKVLDAPVKTELVISKYPGLVLTLRVAKLDADGNPVRHTVVEHGEVKDKPIVIDKTVRFNAHLAKVSARDANLIRKQPGYTLDYILKADFLERWRNKKQRKWCRKWIAETSRRNKLWGQKVFGDEIEADLFGVDEI